MFLGDAFSTVRVRFDREDEFLFAAVLFGFLGMRSVCREGGRRVMAALAFALLAATVKAAE